jgi:hypothetical protein
MDTALAILWIIRLIIVAIETTNKELLSLWATYVAVNNISIESFAMEEQQGLVLVLLSHFMSRSITDLHVNCFIFLDFYQVWSFSTDFSKSLPYQTSRKSVQWERR